MNITDVLDIYLTSKVRVEEWEAEFIARFYKPVIDTVLKTAINNVKDNPAFDQEKLNLSLSPNGQKVLRGE